MSTRKLPPVCLFVLAFAWSSRAGAVEPAKPDPMIGHGGVASVDASAGTASYSIPIGLPEYHGLQPNLALSYNSSGGNGFAGVGWSLSGFGGQIVRGAPSRWGSPSFTADDTFSLDGALLIPCAALDTSVPSCEVDADDPDPNHVYYATQIESYQAIYYERGVHDGWGAWHVLRKDGVRARYTPSLVIGDTTPHHAYNWVATELSDLNGHKVRYDWAQHLGGCCNEYPVSVHYYYPGLGYRRVAQVWWRSRTDVENTQLPNNSRQTTAAIRTIAVYDPSGGQTRAYSLDYAPSLATERLLLSEVQVYGRDFVLENPSDPMAGLVKGGTPLVASRPAYKFAYIADAAARSFTGGTTAQGLCAPGYTRGFGDFNGDGKTDLFCRRPNHSQDTLRIALGTGPATFGPLQTWAHDWCNNGEAGAVPADFNGDGKDDFACIGNKWDGIAVAYSDGATLTNPVWNGGWCPQGDTWGSSAFLGDFNGDGLTDHACAGFYGMKVSLATGTGFAAATDWNPPNLGVLDNPGTGDFNGDGATDLMTWRISDSRVKINVYLSNGADRFKLTPYDWNVAAPAGQGDRGFCSINGTGGPTNWNKQIHTGDFNGDGKTDILCFNAQPDTYGHGEAQISLSRGDRPGPASAWNQPWCGNQSNQVFSTAEVNGDGRTDIVCLNKIAFQGLPQGVAVATSAATRFSTATMWRTGWCNDLPIQPGDFNNDGKGDLLCQGPDNQAYIAFSGGDHGITGQPGTTDLLETITDPLGGATTIGYTPSTRWPGAVGKVPLTQTVREIRSSDGLGGQTSTVYSYEGAKYDRVERRPLGFYRVTAELPRVAGDVGAGRPRTETLYAQDYGSLTKPLWAGTYDAAGNLVTVDSFAYVLGSAGSGRNTVYTSLLGGSWSTTCLAGQPGCLDARTTHVGRCNEGPAGCTSTTGYYDKYGNLLKSVDYGDVSVAAVKTTCTSYATPMDKKTYLRDRVRTTAVHAGVGCGGTRLSEGTSYYDGRLDAVVERGNLSRTTGLLGADHVTTARITRDPYGNVTATADALGLTTRMELDPYARVKKVTTPKGRVTTTTFDPDFGRPASVTTDGLTTTSSYDVHGRASKIVMPTGSPIEFTYVGLGAPAQQYAETRTPGPAGASQQAWRRSYTDGLGRSYASREVAAAPPSPTDVETATIVEKKLYDARGNTYDATFPYVSGKTGAAITRTTHDALNRPLVTTLGDGTTTIARAYDSAPFGVWSTAITDPLGHTNYESTGYWAGATGQGKVEKVCEYVESFGCPGGCYVCKYQYRDLLDRLVRVNYANQYDTDTNTYDTLGRLVSTWNISTGKTDSRYDLAGRLIRTKDARGSLACLTYDDDARLTRSQVTPGVAAGIDEAACVGGGSGATEEVQFAYDEAIPPNLQGCGTMYNEGKQTSITYGGIVRSTGYDKGGQVACTALAIDGYVFVKKFAHDAQGRLTSVSYPDGDVLTMSYDNGGRLSGISAPDRVIVRSPANQAQQGGTVGWSGAPFWQYDAAGALQYFESGNGVRNQITRSATRRWISGVDIRDGSGAALVGYGYDAARGGARDPSGRILKVASTNKAKMTDGLVIGDAVQTITYDPQHRMMTAASPAAGPGEAAWSLDMVYTANGNVVKRMYTVAGAPRGRFNGTFCYPAAPGNVFAVSQVVPVGGACPSSDPTARFSYDNGGNMVAYDGTDANLVIDAFNRLRASKGVGGPLIAYAYDGGGARVKTQSDAATTYYFEDFEWTPGAGTRKSVHFANRVVAVRTNAWSPTGKFVGLPATTTAYAHTNNIGSVVLLTNAAGAVQQRLIYSPWGERMATANAQGVAEAPRSSRRYTGELEDESGLVFLTSRYYDPRLSRFLSPDGLIPTPRLAGLNRYVYVENDPFAFRDPTGHAAKNEDMGGTGKKSTSTTTKTTTTTTQTNAPDGLGVVVGVADLAGEASTAVDQLLFIGHTQDRINDRLKAISNGSTSPVTNKPDTVPGSNAASKIGSGIVGLGIVAHGAQLLSGVREHDLLNVASGGGGLVQDTLAVAKIVGDSGVNMKLLTATRLDKLARPVAVAVGALETAASFGQGYEKGGIPGGLALAAPAAGNAIESLRLVGAIAAGGPAAGVALTVQGAEMAYGALAAATGVGGPTTLGEMVGQLGVIVAVGGPQALQQVGAAVVNDLQTGNNVSAQLGNALSGQK